MDTQSLWHLLSPRLAMAQYQHWSAYALAVTLLAGLALGPLTATTATAADSVYTIANYPVEAQARDAVAAKRQAHKQGQRAALRSLLKRLVPVASYPRLRRLKKLKTLRYVDGITVRAEQNSRTEYLATLDVMFRPKAVKNLLRSQGIPFLDEQAQPIILVPIYLAPTQLEPSVLAAAPALAPEYAQREGQKNWTELWAGLDLSHSLTPVTLRALIPQVHASTISALQAGDNSAYQIITSEYNSEFVVLAIAQPDLVTKRLKVMLIGRDAVDQFSLDLNYRIQEDLLYTKELMAVVSLSILEGRWKATMVKSSQANYGPSQPAMDMGRRSVRFVVTFAGAAEWRRLRTRIAQIEGVSQMEVGGLSARGATISLRYPGGPQRLAQVLAGYRLNLRQVGGGWLLQTN